MYDSIVSTLSQPETTYLLYSFLLVLALLFALEKVLPRRQQKFGMRASRNGVLLLLNTILKLLLPVSMVAASLFALFEQFGLLNMVRLGLWTKIVIAWLLLDFSSYWLHRAYHHFGLLWRFHRVHHSDPAIDITTPFRTHPVELLITLGVKATIIVAFGMPLLGVILYEIIVAVTAVWIHANLRMVTKVESVLEWLLVTPGFHLRHHGVTAEACKCNFGLVLTVWDRIFGTVSTSPLAAVMPTGSACVFSEKETLIGLLAMPFRNVERK